MREMVAKEVSQFFSQLSSRLQVTLSEPPVKLSTTRGMRDAMWMCLLLWLFVAGCGRAGPGFADAGTDAPGVDGSSTDTPGSRAPIFVYPHSRETLYRLAPRTNSLERIGDFGCVSISTDSGDSGDGMTDLAIDQNGVMFGVGRVEPGASSHWLVSVDPTTGSCTRIAGVMLAGSPTEVQGLAFVPVGILDPSREVLVGMGIRGNYFRIDPTTAVAVAIGMVPVRTDTRGGDFVSIVGGGTWIITSGAELVDFDPATGSVMRTVPIIGGPEDNLGMGLGFWGGRIYAMTFGGLLLSIDTRTGVATSVPLTIPGLSVSFRGAAVTTVAPLTPPF